MLTDTITASMDYEPLVPGDNLRQTCCLDDDTCSEINDCEGFPLMDLPPLVLVVVLGSLTANEVSMVSQTCNELYRLCQHNGVWKRVAKRKWGLRPSKGVMRPGRWKHYFSHKMAVMREGSFKWEAMTVCYWIVKNFFLAIKKNSSGNRQYYCAYKY